MTRFHRTELLIGPAAMARLRGSRVAVVGLGAVGSYAVEALARAGVGSLVLADFDVLAPSNLNRQLYALESTLGRPKVEVAAERVRDIHPDCDVTALRVFVDAETVGQILAFRPDILVDAIDSVTPKIQLLTAAVAAGIPVISSMGAATRTDFRDIRVADLSETRVCPLARFLRKRLRRHGVERGITCVFSTEEPKRTAIDPEPPDAQALQRGRKRRSLGSLPHLTGIFGLVIAGEVVQRLLADGKET